MKTVLAVIGGLVVLGIIVVIGGGYWAYKKSGDKMVQLMEPEITKFINEKHPSEAAANALHRIVNAAKKQPSFGSMMLVGAAARSMEDGAVTNEEVVVLDEGSQIAEQREMTKEDIKLFMDRVEKVMPNKRSQPAAPVTAPAPVAK